MSSLLILGLLAFVATIGVNYICTLVVGNIVSNSVVSVFLWAVMFLLLQKTGKQLQSQTDKKKKKKTVLYSGILAYLFALTMVFGYQLKVRGLTDCGFKGKGMMLVWALCLAVAVFPVTCALFLGLFKIPVAVRKEDFLKEWNSKKVFFLCWGAIFLCWIPVFLAYYPAVMSYDFHTQSKQAGWGPPYFNSHHPLIHTLLIWLFFEIGETQLGSLESGMACYSIFQMLIVSVALAYACTMIYRLCKKKWPVIVTAVFFAVFPYHSILAISVTKDVIFAALFLVFLLLIIERLYFQEKHNRNLLDLAIFAEGTLMLLFRNNAIYAVAAFAVFFVLATKGKERIRVFVLCVLILVAGKGALEGLQATTGELGRGSKAEMFSVPMQQFARVGYYHGHELDPETYALLDTYVSKKYWENYNPPIADTVKIFVSQFDFETWEEDMGAMWKAWATIGKMYPNEYLDAFLCLTNGYWFLDDVTWAENLGYGLEERKGALFTFNSTVSDVIPEGIAHESKFPWLEKQLEEIVSNNCFYKWPVVSLLFKPAFYCWILAVCTMAYAFLGKKKDVLLALLPLAYLGTLLFGPVVIVRYVMPIIIASPVLIALLFRKEKTE
ncbi:MAG: hypothetical protein II994_00690 [Lachnospiraceae bacterium]|nr:hypothetical protein [Lachnospiraceae bacterium]